MALLSSLMPHQGLNAASGFGLGNLDAYHEALRVSDLVRGVAMQRAALYDGPRIEPFTHSPLSVVDERGFGINRTFRESLQSETNAWLYGVLD